MASYFFTYLKYLLAGDSDKIYKLKELQQIYKTFKSSKYHYITKDKKITNIFLQKIYSLYTSFNDFKTILETTIFSSDEKKSLLYINHFIESNLPDEIRSKREKFTKEIMWNRVVESDNATKALKEIENEFISYKNHLTRNNLPKLEEEYYLLYKLNSLSTFNFDLFFSKFDSSFIGGNTPNYLPVDGEELLNDLKDLYFLISSLPQKVDLTNAFNRLQRNSDESNKQFGKKAMQAVNKIFKLTTDDLSPQILLALCRYISEDTKLKINIEKKFFSILDKYRKEIEDRFYRNKDYVMEKFSEKSIQQDVYSLFKGKPLQPFKGYNDELVKLIEVNNFDSISGVQAIRITKTFILDNYELIIKDIINNLILEAFFNEKDFQSDFSNKFFAVNELKDFISGFEDNISTSGKVSFNFLKTLLSGYKANNAGGDTKITHLIDQINEKIRHANEKTAEVFYRLAGSIYLILNDYKNQKPVNISNIKTIKGSQNKEFINLLASSYNDIARYIKIIKNYITVENNPNSTENKINN